MTDCKRYLRDLTYTAQQVLDEDLAALERMPERARVERYNNIKANEQELIYEYGRECPDFLTESEHDRVRSDCRLARLLIAASFYTDDTVPQALEDDFIQAELQAVVDFDRYKQFDALDQDQIEERIRRMEGEVYELVQSYTSTQIGNMDRLIQNPDVQQDVIERLVERYEDRRERIRQGFFIYVETHGLEHMVEQIEAAVEAVADATATRKQVDDDVAAEIEQLSSTLDGDYAQQKDQVETQLREIEGALASQTDDPDQLREKLQSLDELDSGPVAALTTGIERVQQLEQQLEDKMAALDDAREDAAQAEREIVREEASQIVDAELEQLTDQRDELRSEINRLQREREEIATARDRIKQRQAELKHRVENIETSVETDAGIEGENVVTASTARLFEMDYIGRFDTSVREVDSITLPDEEFTVPADYWAGRSTHQSEEPRMVSLLDDHDGGDIDTYPTNQASRYQVTTSAYMGLSDELRMVIQAAVYSDLEAYAVNGFDATPASLDGLLRIVNNIIEEANQRSVHYLLGIASPTGWTERVTEQVEDPEFARTQYSRHVSVCLVDLRDGSVIYDASDSLLADNISLFERAVAAERLDECVSVVRGEYLDALGRDTVLLEELVSEHAFKGHVVKQAFDRIESNGDGEQLYLEEDGLAMHTI